MKDESALITGFIDALGLDSGLAAAVAVAVALDIPKPSSFWTGFAVQMQEYDEWELGVYL